MVVNGNTNCATARPTVNVCWATRFGHFSTHASYSRMGPTCTSSTFWYNSSGTMAANDTSQMSTNVLATLHRNTEPRGFRTIVKYLSDNNRDVKKKIIITRSKICCTIHCYAKKTTSDLTSMSQWYNTLDLSI